MDSVDSRVPPEGNSSVNTEPALVAITSSFPIKADGSEAAGSFAADLVEELSKELPVRVVAPGGASGHEAWCPGVEVFRYACPDQPLSTLRPWNPMDAWRILQVMLAGRAATEAAIAHGPVRHILALWALPCGDWARYAADKCGASYSVWTLGSDIWTLGRIPLVRARLARVLRDAERCWSDGLKLAEDTRAISGRPVEFLPSTRRISSKRSVPLKSAPPYRLLFLGRWHKNKGVDLLLDALKMLDESDWKRIEAVEICGGGPLESIVRSGVEELRAAGKPVVLRGFLDRVAAEEAFLRADWLLIPSRVESIPVVFSDAVKLGCPVIAMPVGDLPRLLDDPPCGVLSASASAEGFADAISQAVAGSAQEFAPGMAAHLKTFDLQVVARRLACM
ncbi:glycosyltransferase [Luteimonas salinisoli]|uniref:glycosyltransferase n=1 Tax=Luteimonas salinisoli TaxID=2752307 RepID=UPI0031F2F154